jgi:hypothetical protein
MTFMSCASFASRYDTGVSLACDDNNFNTLRCRSPTYLNGVDWVTLSGIS